jgi:hypothetical protein
LPLFAARAGVASWLISISRSARRSSTLRSDSGHLTYIIKTKRITSGELLKFERLLMALSYHDKRRPKIALTPPSNGKTPIANAALISRLASRAGEGETGPKLRIRPESFADHYGQARRFYRSMSAPDQRQSRVFAFELSKVETPVIRGRMLGHLALIEEALARAVDMEGERAEITPYRSPMDLDPS